MRIQGLCRASLNGFRCNDATWEDALNRDGFRDEVSFHVERGDKFPGPEPLSRVIIQQLRNAPHIAQ